MVEDRSCREEGETSLAGIPTCSEFLADICTGMMPLRHCSTGRPVSRCSFFIDLRFAVP